MKNYLKNIKFECVKGCANCCRLSGGYVFLSEDEAAAIAQYIEADEAEFLKWLTRMIDERLCLVDGDEENCVFLEGGKCAVYAVRPLQCRTYPFWTENMKTKGRWEVTGLDCPGIGKGNSVEYKEIVEISKGKSLDSMR